MDGDCDDSNPSAYPGAAELDSTYECMTDEDGDGWGDPDPSSGEVVPGTDCDDRDPNKIGLSLDRLMEYLQPTIVMTMIRRPSTTWTVMAS